MDVLGQSSCIRVNVVVFGQKRLYSGKSGCNRAKWFFRAKVVVVRPSGYIRTKVVVFLQSGCIGTKWLYSGKSGYIRAK